MTPPKVFHSKVELRVLKNKCELHVLENMIKSSLNIRSIVDWECD